MDSWFHDVVISPQTKLEGWGKLCLGIYCTGSILVYSMSILLINCIFYILIIMIKIKKCKSSCVKVNLFTWINIADMNRKVWYLWWVIVIGLWSTFHYWQLDTILFVQTSSNLLRMIFFVTSRSVLYIGHILVRI